MKSTEKHWVGKVENGLDYPQNVYVTGQTKAKKMYTFFNWVKTIHTYKRLFKLVSNQVI